MHNGFPPRLLGYLGLTFMISWSVWLIAVLNGGPSMSAGVLPFFVLGSFGPLIAAVVLRVRNREGVSSPAVVGMANPARYKSVPVAFLLGGAAPCMAVLATALLRAPGLDLRAGLTAMQDAGGPVLAVLAYLVVGPLSEEPGWRGYAYPRLRQHANRLSATVFLGVIWAAWHLPLFFINGTFQNAQGLLTAKSLLFFVNCLPLSVVIGHAYEKLGGLPAAISVHFAFNLLSTVFGLTSTAAAGWSTLFEGLLAAVLLFRGARHQPGAVVTLGAGDANGPTRAGGLPRPGEHQKHFGDAGEWPDQPADPPTPGH